MHVSSLLFASFAAIAVAKNQNSDSTVSIVYPPFSKYSNRTLKTDLAPTNLTQTSTSSQNKGAQATGGATTSTNSTTPVFVGNGGKKSGNSTKTGAAGGGAAAPTGNTGPAKNGTATATARPVQATGGAVAVLAQSGGFVTVAGLGVVFAVFM